MTCEEVLKILNNKKANYYFQPSFMAGWDSIHKQHFPELYHADFIFTPLNREQSVSLYFNRKDGKFIGYNIFDFPYNADSLLFITDIETVYLSPSAYSRCESNNPNKLVKLPREIFTGLGIGKYRNRETVKYTLLDLVKGWRGYNARMDFPMRLVIVRVPSGYIAYGEYKNGFSARMDFDAAAVYQSGCICKDNVQNAKKFYPHTELIPAEAREFQSLEHVLNSMLVLMEEADFIPEA